MLIKALLVVSSVLCLSSAVERPAEMPASIWDDARHVEYVPGNSPIVISAPHGGGLKPRDVDDRTKGKTVRDSFTLEIGRELCDRIEERTGKRPHFIVCHLHRSKLDANREIGEAAQGNTTAQEAWRNYHGFIERARKVVAKEHGTGLYVDLHGQSHAEDWVEWGYTLPARLLELTDEEINAKSFDGEPSIRTLAGRSELELAELIRGSESLGARLAAFGYECVPSPRHPDPGGGDYYSGGYSTKRHGSRDAGAIDGVQLELPRGVRKTSARRDEIARDVALVLIDFVGQHYGVDWIESE